jgi:hypothetical protein
MPTGISISSGGSITTNNTVYVATNGVDATGARNNLAKPFLTLEAARDAALSGDTIFVYPGAYTVTSTATNGLAKDGVNWYFYPGAIVNKSTAGPLFMLPNTFTIGCNIYGNASFNLSGSATYGIFAHDTANIMDIEFDSFASSTTWPIIWIYARGKDVNIIGKKQILSTGSDCIWHEDANGRSIINIPTIRSTARYAIWGRSYMVIATSATVSSTANYAIYTGGGTFNVASCSGTPQAFRVGYRYYGQVQINGRVDSISYEGFGNGVSLNGFIDQVIMNDTYRGQLIGGNIGNLTLTDGYVDTTVDNSANPSTLTVSGGLANLKTNNGRQLKLLQSGGIVNLSGTLNTTTAGNYFESYVTGGRLNLTGLYAKFFQGKQFIRVAGGVLNLGNATLVQQATGPLTDTTWGNTVIIRYESGTLISNGATLINNDPNGLVIALPTAARNIKVLSGGLNTNTITGLLSAKKQKSKQTVLSVLTTSIQLNDGVGGWEVFTVSDTVTYNTTAKIAQQMAVLINASGTLDVTATQDTPGTDAYFYVESDVAGTPFTQQVATNLTTAVIRENSYALTNTTGGVIIEDADVE